MSSPMWCDGCRAVGAIHCAHPDECGNMLSATAAADQWKAWLDDLPLPFTFDPAIGRLQDFITALTTLIDVPQPASPAEAERDTLAAANAALEAKVAGLVEQNGQMVAEALGIVADEATSDEIPGGHLPPETPDWHRGYDAAIRKARAALATQEAGNG